MAGKSGLRTKLRYWFDNTMSRGISGLIGWLAVASFALIDVVTIALEVVAPTDADGQPNNPIRLLTSGLSQKMDQLRKGRSVVVERDHTVILGWLDQVFTLISELAEANRS